MIAALSISFIIATVTRSAYGSVEVEAVPYSLRGVAGEERKLRSGAFYCGEQHTYLGCYADGTIENRAMVGSFGAPLTYYQCAEQCRAGGYAYMGRTYLEQCFCSNDSSDTTGFARFGETTGCNCYPTPETGLNIGDFKICVYDVSTDNAVTLTPTQDTELYQAGPTTSYGSLTSFKVVQASSCSGSSRVSLIEFDLTDITINPTCATLRLYVPDTSSGIRKWINISRLQDGFTWIEDDLTWNIFFGASVQGTLGGTQLFVKQVNDENQFVEVDVGDLVAGYAGRKITLYLFTERYENNVAIGCNTIEFSSNDAAEERRPRLIITGDEFPTSMPSDSPSGLPSESPSLLPTEEPSESPSIMPSEPPSLEPSDSPSESPSMAPSCKVQCGECSGGYNCCTGFTCKGGKCRQPGGGGCGGNSGGPPGQSKESKLP